MTIEYCTPVPGDECGTALEAVGRIAAGASRLRVAVAFVTHGGVGLLEAVLEQHAELAVELVARGAPITDPDSLERLTERGVAVSVVVGSHAVAFHPKLWIAEQPNGLHVLSGSGNLTAGGLRDNNEQFEVLRVPADDTARTEEQEQRFTRLTDASVPLGVVQHSPYWSLWKRQLAERRKLAEQEHELDQTLGRTADAGLAVEALYGDLVDFYERTKREVEIPAPAGGVRRYVASYFKRAIDDSQGTTGPVPVVAHMVKKPTDGYDHLAAANRPDLMVETLVVDTSKSYHRLFLRETVAHARANLDAYHASQAGSDSA